MSAWPGRPIRRALFILLPVAQKKTFLLLAAASLFVLLLLARHSSTEPTVFGRWSPRFAAILAIWFLLTLTLAVFAVPACRRPILRRSIWSASRGRAWALMALGLAALPLLHFLLRKWLFPEKDPVFVLFAALVLMASVSLMSLMMWRSGMASITISPSFKAIILALLASHLLLATIYLGQAPGVDIVDETRIIGNSVRQFACPNCFVHLLAERNAFTWFNHLATWPLIGAWLQAFGAGLLQARFLSLLVAWLGVPFIFLTARKVSGPSAALIAAVCGIVLPLHLVTARTDVWVATTVSIALCCYTLARKQDSSRRRVLSFFCGFFALSAIEGHAYGVGFALAFGALHVPALLRVLRGRSTGNERETVTGYTAGSLGFLLLWVIYHIVLAGADVTTLPELLQATLDYERGLAGPGSGVGLFLNYIRRFTQRLFYDNPYVLFSAAFGLMLALRQDRAAARSSLTIAVGGGILILLMLAHFSVQYFVFFLPFFCLFAGTGLAGLFPTPETTASPGTTSMSLGTLFVVAAFVLLNTLQLDETATLQQESNERAEAIVSIGQEIDQMLPAEDIVVAGTPEFYLGMTWRLNYSGLCGFTYSDPAYWPLDKPQAVLSTPGWDKGCDLLADWLIDHDFQPARCFSGHGLGDGTTILFLTPDLMPREDAIDCSLENLVWLETP